MLSNDVVMLVCCISAPTPHKEWLMMQEIRNNSSVQPPDFWGCVTFWPFRANSYLNATVALFELYELSPESKNLWSKFLLPPSQKRKNLSKEQELWGRGLQGLNISNWSKVLPALRLNHQSKKENTAANQLTYWRGLQKKVHDRWNHFIAVG